MQSISCDQSDCLYRCVAVYATEHQLRPKRAIGGSSRVESSRVESSRVESSRVDSRVESTVDSRVGLEADLVRCASHKGVEKAKAVSSSCFVKVAGVQMKRPACEVEVEARWRRGEVEARRGGGEVR